MMKKIIFLFLAVLFTYQSATAQKLITKMSKEICKCMESFGPPGNRTQVESVMQNCMMKSMIQHMPDMKKELGIDITDDADGSKLTELLVMDLAKRCDIFTQYVMMFTDTNKSGSDSTGSEIRDPDLVPYEPFLEDTMKVNKSQCESIHNARFDYQNLNAVKEEKSYFVIDGKTSTEYTSDGQYVTKSTIKWKDDCTFEATFIESTDPNISILFKKGDTVLNRIIGIYGNTVYVKTNYGDVEFIKTFKVQKK